MIAPIAGAFNEVMGVVATGISSRDVARVYALKLDRTLQLEFFSQNHQFDKIGHNGKRSDAKTPKTNKCG